MSDIAHFYLLNVFTRRPRKKQKKPGMRGHRNKTLHNASVGIRMLFNFCSLLFA
jgi:hypothetical protein